MNVDAFKKYITPALERNLPASISVFSDIFADGYLLCTVGHSQTIYGAKLIYADKTPLRNATFLALSSNFVQNDINKLPQNYKIMALGFSQYWTTARFDLKVPMPALVSAVPPQGTTIFVPGIIEPFATYLALAFIQGVTERSVSVLCAALTSFHLTISGFVTGNTSTGPVPSPIPWTGII